jgi:pyruvate kinase
LIDKLKRGEKVYLDNGMIELAAKHRRTEFGFEMEVLNNGKIKTRKGINFPSLAKYIPSFTAKDRKDLIFNLKQGVDFIALSFVKGAKDITDLRRRMETILGRKTGLPLIVAKIETLTALSNLKEILEVADGVMVARGDMGVEAPPEKVPIYQKIIIRHCIKKGIPVIVATNMLESMTDFPRPTRAELTDVANAVIDRSDAVMLSGETASGKYPLRSVQMMSKIVRITERSPFDDLNEIPELEKKRSRPASDFVEITSQSIYNVSVNSAPKAIVMKTVPPVLIKAVSNLRPEMPIWCFFGNHNAWSRKLVLWRGVIPFFSEASFKKRISKLNNFLLIEGRDEGGKWKFTFKIKHKKF